MSVDEFIEQYTQTEADKIERRDPLKKVAEKTPVGKAAETKKI